MGFRMYSEDRGSKGVSMFLMILNLHFNSGYSQDM